MPSKRSTLPANRKVSPGVSVSRKYSSILPSTGPPRATVPRAGARIAHVEHRHLDDGADIQPVLLGDAADWRPANAVLGAADAGIALVGAQRIAAGRDEIDDAVEGRAVEPGIGRGAAHLLVELVGDERLAAGAAEHMLRQHVERAVEQRRRVLRAEIVGLERGAAFQHLEAVGRHQDGAARLVHAVVGAADALRQPAGALRRADMDDQVDVAPVDAEVERRGRDDGAQAVGLHRLLDAAPLADVERAVMQRDRQVVLVDPPELLEQHLGLAARVDEQQRRPVLA